LELAAAQETAAIDMAMIQGATGKEEIPRQGIRVKLRFWIEWEIVIMKNPRDAKRPWSAQVQRGTSGSCAIRSPSALPPRPKAEVLVVPPDTSAIE
jgi:hypothetical protein